ncbi:MAG: hypothetical protein ACRC46_11115 [Thermoguttaceae bacterium]
MPRKSLINPTGIRVLRTFHLIFAMLWLGCGVAILLVLIGLPADSTHPDEVYYKAMALRTIDDYGIIPGAAGSLLTGFLYGVLTPWGFLRQRWLITKWSVVLTLALFGIIALGPWINANAAMVEIDRSVAMKHADFGHNLIRTYFWTPFQAVALVCVVILSVFKPWRGLPSIPVNPNRVAPLGSTLPLAPAAQVAASSADDNWGDSAFYSSPALSAISAMSDEDNR